MADMEVAGKQHGSKLPHLDEVLALFTGRTVKARLRVLLALLLVALCSETMAVGLGELTTKTALGQPLLAYINLVNTGGDIENRCFKATLNTVDGNRLAPISLSVHNADGTLYMSTREALNEPAVVLTVEYVCSSQTSRDYQILLDLQPATAPPIVAAAPKSANTLPAAASAAPSASGIAPPASDAAPTARKPRHHRSDSDVAANSAAANSAAVAAAQARESQSQEKRRGKSSAKALRNVLRLGNDPSVDDNLNGVEGMHLALSHGLRGANADLDVAPAETPAPQAGAAAADGVAGAATEAKPSANDIALKELQAKIQQLEAQTEELKQLNAKNLADLAAAQKEKQSGGSLIYLYFLLLASFAAIGWLLWRTRQIQAGINHSWEEMVPEHEHDAEAEPKQQATHFDETDDFLDQPAAKPEVRVAAPLKPVFKASLDEQVAPAAPRDQDFLATVVLPKPEEHDHAEGDYKFPGNVRTALPDAEEILDEIQQAEFWMDMQQPQRAIEILESNWGSERPSSPLPWLYLFDLYRMVGDKQKYLDLTERFERIFNGKVIAWADVELLQHSRSLEDFPVLLKKITQLWGTDDLVPFMENLLIDDRDGRRQGFDLAAYRDILFLTNVAYEIQDARDYTKPPSMAPEWSIIK
jgi:hypothetical protein